MWHIRRCQEIFCWYYDNKINAKIILAKILLKYCIEIIAEKVKYNNKFVKIIIAYLLLKIGADCGSIS